MSEADDLARRFFALWTEYLTALLSDPKTAALLQGWVGLAGRMPGIWPADSGGGTPSRSPSGAAAAATASGEREPAVADLARRIDELAERVAALEDAGERLRGSAGVARRRNRPSRS